MSEKSEPNTGALNRFWSSKASAIGALVVIALVVLSIGGLIVWNTIDNTKDAPAGAEGGLAATAPASTPPSKTAAGGCAVPAGDQSLRPTLPKDLDWKAANGVTWPVSATVGPTQSNADGLGICFAKSPLGAALMATNAFGTLEGVDGLKGTELYIAESPGKADSLKQSTSGPSTDEDHFVASGFSVVDFDAAAGKATVTLIVPVPTSSNAYTSMQIPLRWVDGDWKIYLSSGGATDWIYEEAVPGQFISWKEPK